MRASSKVAPEPVPSSQETPAPPGGGDAQAPTPALPAAAERSQEDKKAYGDHHRPRLEAEIKTALNQAIDEGAADPVARVGELLLAAGGGPQPKLELPPADEEASDKWSLTAWLRGAGVHRVAAAVLQRGMAGRDGLTVLKGLDDRGALSALLSAGALAEGLADLLWPEVETLKRAGAATGEEIQSKFAGSIEMSYAGLNTFFGGLEGVVGAPDPQSYEKMEEEHTKMPDSNQEFTTGNYGVKTSSALEWDFVVDEEDAGPTHPAGRDAWPSESEEKLRDRSKCRKKQLLAELMKKAEALNERLDVANNPKLLLAEIVAASLYTGPTFEKYNAVLRGLQSESDFLRNTLVRLCCPKKIAEHLQYNDLDDDAKQAVREAAGSGVELAL